MQLPTLSRSWGAASAAAQIRISKYHPSKACAAAIEPASAPVPLLGPTLERGWPTGQNGRWKAKARTTWKLRRGCEAGCDCHKSLLPARPGGVGAGGMHWHGSVTVCGVLRG